MNRKITLFIGVGTAFVALLVYCKTLAHGLTFIDSGELAAVCTTLGIAHPTGYPVYTLVGWLFTHILNGRPIYLLNLMSAILSCLSLFMFYIFVSDIFLGTNSSSRLFQKELPGPLAGLSLGCGTLLLAFSKVFWSVSLVTEAYALHVFFISLLMLLSIKAFCNGAGNKGGEFFWICVFFFALGVSFCNHMSTVLIIPALFYFMISQRKVWKPDGRKLFILLIIFIAGLSFYAYLPIRASQFPELNWGNPQTWERFFWHVAGKQYRVWMFSSFDVALKQGEYFVQLVLQSFGFIPVLLIPFGVWYLFHVEKHVCWFSVIFFLTDVLYAINYDIKDIDAYFLPAFIVCGVWMAGSLIFFVSLFYAKKKVLYKTAVAALCSFPLIPLVLNYSEVDQSKNNHVEHYVENILRSVEKNSLLLSYQWDYFCSPFYYLQLVEGLRTDVTMIEVKLLKRSWYLTQLKNNYPELMRKSEDEVERFSRELYKFEHGQPYEPEVIQARYIDMINSFVRKSFPARPVYVTCEMEAEVGAEFQRVPEGLVFRLYPFKKGYSHFDFSVLGLPSEDDFSKGDRCQEALKSFYAFMLSSRGIYEIRFGNLKDARELITMALGISREHPLAKKGLAALEQRL